MNMRGDLIGNIHIQTKSKEYDVHVGKEVLSHLTTISSKYAASGI